MKYPDLWERAQKIHERILEEVIEHCPTKTNRHRSLVSKAVSGGAYNNSVRLMAYYELQNGLTEDEIVDIAKERVSRYYINTSTRHKINTKKQEDLEYYRQTQKQLGNT